MLKIKKYIVEYFKCIAFSLFKIFWINVGHIRFKNRKILLIKIRV